MSVSVSLSLSFPLLLLLLSHFALIVISSSSSSSSSQGFFSSSSLSLDVQYSMLPTVWLLMQSARQQSNKIYCCVVESLPPVLSRLLLRITLCYGSTRLERNRLTSLDEKDLVVSLSFFLSVCLLVCVISTWGRRVRRRRGQWQLSRLG